MPAVVSNATRIWELNIHWDLYSQCGIWDAKGRGVDIYECIRAHQSTPNTQVSRRPFVCHVGVLICEQPPNSVYWRYVARR
ncbi:hypothetical protein H4582DRAFT_1866754 [Lactarius indigo]|nr:hypothetical protein H4582DRAFT_1866754 [Lactarius indigo]